MRRVSAIWAAFAVVAVLAGTATAARPFETAVYPDPRGHGSTPVVYERIAAAGATKGRLALDWRRAAPEGAKAPAGFDAADPADPAYRWSAFDRQVRLALQNG